MQRERQNKQNKPGKETKEGYIIVPNYFLKKWVRVLGVGPVVLYQELLTYCHKEKTIAWPSLATLSYQLGISKNSLLNYRKILLKYGLIEKIVKRRTARGNYQSNVYKVTPIESAKNKLRQVQNLGEGSSKIAPGVVQNLHPNNNNLNSINITTTNREKDAVVDFKKLKEKGEERMRVIRQRMMELDFKEEFVEKILKDFSPRKIEEKLDLLMEKRNIQSPAGWLMAALKNDYQDVEEPSRITPHPHLDPPPSRGRKFNVIANDRRERGNLVSTLEQVSREKALEAIRLIQDNLSACISPLPSGKSSGMRENRKLKTENHFRLKGENQCPN